MIVNVDQNQKNAKAIFSREIANAIVDILWMEAVILE